MKKILLAPFAYYCICAVLLLSIVLSGCDDGGKKNTESRLTDAEIMKLRSDSLYKIEGDTIFGNFRFGMSRKEFDTLCDSIKKEFSGMITCGGDCKYNYKEYPLVRIADNDMLIITDFCYFYNDSLYQLNVSKYVGATYRKYSYFGTGCFKEIKERLEKKYGEPSYYHAPGLEAGEECRSSWNFNHKNIYVSIVNFKDWSHDINDDFDFMTHFSEDYADYILRIKFVQKNLKEKAKIRKKKLEEKRKAERKREQAREDSINKKKESFAKGL